MFDNDRTYKEILGTPAIEGGSAVVFGAAVVVFSMIGYVFFVLSHALLFGSG